MSKIKQLFIIFSTFIGLLSLSAASVFACVPMTFSENEPENVQDIIVNDDSGDAEQRVVSVGDIVSEGGIYQVDDNASNGKITIATEERVILTGKGISGTSKDSLTIDCVKSGTDLVIENLRIDSATNTKSAISFTGTGNRLTIKGNNLLQQCYNDGGNESIINVSEGTELTIEGDGILYLYLHGYTGAAIGGNDTKSGDITFDGPEVLIYMVNSESAAIGGSTDGGNITFRSGEVSVYTTAFAPAVIIGTKSDVTIEEGASVTFENGLFGGVRIPEIDVASDEKHGRLIIEGGSLRLINSAEIPCDVVNSSGEKASLCVVPESVFVKEDGEYDICVDGSSFYKGAGHRWKYIESNIGVTSSFRNDTEAEKNLYFYLTENNHQLSMADINKYVVWDKQSGEFILTDDRPDEPNDSESSGTGGTNQPGSSGTDKPSRPGSSGSGGGSSRPGSSGTDRPNQPDSPETDNPNTAGSKETQNQDSENNNRLDDMCTGGEKCVSRQFFDIGFPVWYHDAIDYVVKNEIFHGISETKFAPDRTMTRGMAVTILSRLESIDQLQYTGKSFSDVPEEKWYSAAVKWAFDHNIVYGVDSELFCPDTEITREQLISILYRYAKYKNSDLQEEDADIPFSDKNQISYYARTAVAWACKSGLAEGKDGNRFDPAAGASRAEAAEVIMRLSSYVL